MGPRWGLPKGFGGKHARRVPRGSFGTGRAWKRRHYAHRMLARVLVRAEASLGRCVGAAFGRARLRSQPQPVPFRRQAAAVGGVEARRKHFGSRPPAPFLPPPASIPAGEPLSVAARRKHFQAAKNRAGVTFSTQHVWTFHLWQVRPGMIALQTRTVTEAKSVASTSKPPLYSIIQRFARCSLGLQATLAVCTTIIILIVPDSTTYQGSIDYAAYVLSLSWSPTTHPSQPISAHPHTLPNSTTYQEFIDYAAYVLSLSYSSYDLTQHLDGQPLQVGGAARFLLGATPSQRRAAHCRLVGPAGTPATSCHPASPTLGSL